MSWEEPNECNPAGCVFVCRRRRRSSPSAQGTRGSSSSRRSERWPSAWTPRPSPCTGPVNTFHSQLCEVSQEQLFVVPSHVVEKVFWTNCERLSPWKDFPGSDVWASQLLPSWWWFDILVCFSVCHEDVTCSTLFKILCFSSSVGLMIWRNQMTEKRRVEAPTTTQTSVKTNHQTTKSQNDSCSIFPPRFSEIPSVVFP